MRRRITALLLGGALLATTFAGQQAAMAQPSAKQPKTSTQQWTTVVIRTGNDYLAGTDATVELWLQGSGGTFYQALSSRGRNLERSRSTTYHLRTGDIGDIVRVGLKRDNSGFSPSWYVRSVEVYRHTFRYDMWLPAGSWVCSPPMFDARGHRTC